MGVFYSARHSSEMKDLNAAHPIGQKRGLLFISALHLTLYLHDVDFSPLLYKIGTDKTFMLTLNRISSFTHFP